MSGHVHPKDKNPNPHHVPDPPGQVNQTVKQIKDAVKTDTTNEYNGMVANNQLTPPWRHGFRILQGPVPAGSSPAPSEPSTKTATESGKNTTRLSATYKTIRDLDPKKQGLTWVDADGQTLMQDTLNNIINRLSAVGLLGQYNAVVRVCPFNADGSQNQNGCGCGCNS
jgi:hypothetical protein